MPQAGKTNLEIVEEVVIAEGMARRHVSNLYEKIGTADRAPDGCETLTRMGTGLDRQLKLPVDSLSRKVFRWRLYPYLSEVSKRYLDPY